MKLIDIDKEQRFSTLLDNMGATKIPFIEHQLWNGIDDELEKLLLNKILELSQGLEELVFNDQGTYFRGRKVLIYIRDQSQKYYEKGYKYHISKCKTIRKFINDGRQARYMISLRTDGIFEINLTDFGKIVKEGLEEELDVCYNCLQNLNLGNRNSFNLNSFLNDNATLIDDGLFRDQNDAPINIYPSDWREISLNYRKSVDFKCESCGVDKKSNPSSLHCHHRDGDKSNNMTSNLKALCFNCHSQEPGHGHMKNLGSYI